MSDLSPTELVDTAHRVAEEILVPRAEETDQAALVPRSNLDALARAGLFGIAGGGGPAGSGPGTGAGALPTAAMRQVQETLAGACGATYFVWAQHHSPVRRLSASTGSAVRERWLDRLCRGEALAGVAFAYLRRPGPPSVSAQRKPGGWQVRGVAPFVTSWGLADVFVVAAASEDDDQLVWFCLEGRATEAVRPSSPMALSVLQATSTVVLSLEGLFVPDDDVVGIEPMSAWRARDRLATTQPSAAAFGVAQRCCWLLAGVAADREGTGPGPVGHAAGELADELDRCRAHAYGLADALVGGGPALPVDTAMTEPEAGDGGRSGQLAEHLDAMVRARTWGLDLAQRASLALVASVGGRAMALAHPAQRLVREAAFYSVQAQTGAIRTATLNRLAHPLPDRTDSPGA